TTTSAEQPTTDNTQTTTSGEQPNIDNTQTTTSDNTQTTTSDNTQTTTTSTEQPTTDTTQTTTNTSEGNATSKPEPKTTNTTKDLATISESQGKYLTEAKTLGQIKFDINEIKLSSPAKETINSLISEIKEYDPNRVTIKVEGHTSKVGDARLNQEISQDRADIVVKYLKGQNLPYQVIGEGVGYSQPLPNSDPASNVNQRTVIILTPTN
ncbi:MAG: OmpA family protein, partial [Trichodesmium sp. MAG_R02]|nr:OmpA family protein [Trichodesmium sp. MAG_R02]